MIPIAGLVVVLLTLAWDAFLDTPTIRWSITVLNAILANVRYVTTQTSVLVAI